MTKILFAIGNALLTIGSMLALFKRFKYFGGRVKHHNKPKYTKQQKPKNDQSSTASPSNRDG